MALLPAYYTTTRLGGKSKVKKKPGWKARKEKHDAWLRENGVHPDQLKARRKEFKPLKISQAEQDRVKAREDYDKKYPSVSNGMSGNTFKKEPQKYTGTLVTGIAQMHKSNAVPVINKEQAVDIAKMRRG
jgi:hypothetical protein|tara:strand:+ start:2622 stop:3011 length:390 start_codon:yes stop_codon:yes gene_type:complete